MYCIGFTGPKARLGSHCVENATHYLHWTPSQAENGGGKHGPFVKRCERPIALFCERCAKMERLLLRKAYRLAEESRDAAVGLAESRLAAVRKSLEDCAEIYAEGRDSFSERGFTLELAEKMKATILDDVESLGRAKILLQSVSDANLNWFLGPQSYAEKLDRFADRKKEGLGEDAYLSCDPVWVAALQSWDQAPDGGRAKLRNELIRTPRSEYLAGLRQVDLSIYALRSSR